MRYKIVNLDAKQKELMIKNRVSACTYCDYADGEFCLFVFSGKRCPAGKEEYLKKIYK